LIGLDRRFHSNEQSEVEENHRIGYRTTEEMQRFLRADSEIEVALFAGGDGIVVGVFIDIEIGQ
jgi:hypothetical protein